MGMGSIYPFIECLLCASACGKRFLWIHFCQRVVGVQEVCVCTHVCEHIMICVRIYEPVRAKVCICGCECVICVLKCVNVYSEAESPPTHQAYYMMCPPPAPMPESSPGVGTPEGARPCLVNNMSEVRPTELGWTWQRGKPRSQALAGPWEALPWGSRRHRLSWG